MTFINIKSLVLPTWNWALKLQPDTYVCEGLSLALQRRQFLSLLLFSASASFYPAHDLSMPGSCLLLLSFLSAGLAPSEPIHSLSRGAPCPLFHIARHTAWYPKNNRSVIVVTLRFCSKSFPPGSLLWLMPPHSYQLPALTLPEPGHWM